MNNIIIGTAGHVDHGKTCLIRALTGIDTDRLEEEKRRGITIELGFAYLDLPNGERAGIIDVPGHEKFIRNMLAGAGGIDIALLVIAADEGIMPQTKEHMGILSLLDIKRGCIALTKKDAVDEEWLELVLEDIKGELEGTQWENMPIIPVSAYTGEGIDTLKTTLFGLVEETKGKSITKPFRLPIDRVFSMQGFGTVVTGTLIEGTMREGQEIMIYPEGKPTRIRNLQVHSNPVQEAYAGQRVAVNLLKIKKEEIDRGCVLAEPGSMHTTMMLDVTLRILPESERTIKNGSRLHFYHGAEDVLCKAVLLGDVEELLPGQECYAQLRFEEPLAAKSGDHYVVRFYSPIETIGGGTILDPCPYKHKRADEQTVKRLELLNKGGGDEQLEAIILEHSPHFVDKGFILLQTAMTADGFEAAIERLKADEKITQVTDKVFLHNDYITQLGQKLKDFLAQYHKDNPLKLGAKREEVRGRLYKHIDSSLADKVIDCFVENGTIAMANDCLRLREHTVTFTPKQTALKAAVLAKYEHGGFTPPEKTAIQAEFGKDKDLQKVLDFLIDEGDIVPADSELYFTRSCMEKAMEEFAKLNSANGVVTLAEFRDAIGASRKFAMAILDCWDKKGITKKTGDVRTLVK